MESNCKTWIAAHLLAAACAIAFPVTAHAGAMDGQTGRDDLATGAAISGVELDASRQLARANAAYAQGDYAEAFRLYRNIAVLGLSEAHYRLGLMYVEGRGTRKNARQAEYWLTLAATEKYPGAAEALASLKTIDTRG